MLRHHFWKENRKVLFINCCKSSSLISSCCDNDCNKRVIVVKNTLPDLAVLSWHSSDTFNGMFPTGLKGAGLTAFPFNPALISPVGSINLLRHKSFYRLTEQLSYALLYCTHRCYCRSTRLNISFQIIHSRWCSVPAVSGMIDIIVLIPHFPISTLHLFWSLRQEEIVWLTCTVTNHSLMCCSGELMIQVCWRIHREH